MLPQQRRRGVQRRQAAVLYERDIRRIKHALQCVFPVKPLGELQNAPVALGRRADDHLRGLPAGHEARRAAVPHEVVRVLADAVPDARHRREDTLLRFLRREAREALVRGQLDIDAHAVRKQPERPDQRFIRAGDRLHVDVAAEAVLPAQNVQRF